MNVISYKCALDVSLILDHWMISHDIIYKKCYKCNNGKISLTDFDVVSSEYSLCAPGLEELYKALIKLKPTSEIIQEFTYITDLDQYAYKLVEYIKKIKRSINTSYFSNWKNIFNQNTLLISIAGKSPDFFTELTNTYTADYKIYKKLAPKYEWWKEWHDNNLSNEWYEEKYNETVLSKLDPQQVFNELTDNNRKDVVLLCWEGRDKFCHRHLVAKWLENNLNINVQEL